jgi:hypothetical protein
MVCKYTAEHIFIYNSYAKSDSARVCHRELKKSSLVLIFLQGLLDKKIKRRCHTLTEEKFDDNGARLENQPRKSLAKLNQQVDILVSSARTPTKLLKSCPQNTQVYSLQPKDLATKINFCNWFIQSVKKVHLTHNYYFLLTRTGSI